MWYWIGYVSDFFECDRNLNSQVAFNATLTSFWPTLHCFVNEWQIKLIEKKVCHRRERAGATNIIKTNMEDSSDPARCNQPHPDPTTPGSDAASKYSSVRMLPLLLRIEPSLKYEFSFSSSSFVISPAHKFAGCRHTLFLALSHTVPRHRLQLPCSLP